jgi:hypothetical protein
MKWSSLNGFANGKELLDLLFQRCGWVEGTA